MDDNTLANEKSMRSFLVKKYVTEYIFMLTIFLFIGVSRWYGFFDNATTGTLAGTTIGYFAGSIRKLHA